MFDRLAELRRQRALVQEHLAWLDKQIADVAGSSAASPVASVTPPPAPPKTEAAAVVAAALKASAASPAPVEAPEVAAAANAILDEYRVAPDTLKTDVRKGCVLYFVGALAVVALSVAVLWFAFRH